jgi:hypothetical protein
MDTRALRIFLADSLDMAVFPDFTRIFFGLNHEMLSGEGKGGKVRELVSWCERLDKIGLLNQIGEMILFLGEKFNSEEVKTLASDLRIDLESIAGGESKPVLIVKVLITLHAQGRFGDLITWMDENRPDITPVRRLNAGQ